MDVPQNWQPGYKDLDDKLLMVYFKDAKTGVTLEGVYLRKVQPATFTLEDFKKWRIAAEGKRYEGKDHQVLKEAPIAIGGETGNYLLTHLERRRPGVREAHRAIPERRPPVHGGTAWSQGKVDKAVFDHAVKSFALGKE